MAKRKAKHALAPVRRRTATIGATSSLVSQWRALALSLSVHPDCTELDGRRGMNRAPAGNQLGVETDLEAAWLYIEERAQSPDTQRLWSLEVRRLIAWAWYVCPRSDKDVGKKVRVLGKAISSLSRADIKAYMAYVEDEDQLRVADAIGPKVNFLTSEGLLNPAWRPYEGPLKLKHREQVLRTLQGLFAYWEKTRYLAGNPAAGLRAKKRGSMGDHTQREETKSKRKLDARQWQATLETIEAMPKDTEAKRDRYERTRFVFDALFFLGARIGEVATHRMQHFSVKRVVVDGTEQDAWEWSVVGKGGKLAEVPVTSVFLASLMRYRTHFGLPPLPDGDDDLPLVFDYRALRKAQSAGATVDPRELLTGIGERRIFDLVKDVFWETADRLMEEEDRARAKALRCASPHWIRHAFGSFLADQVESVADFNRVRDLVRHANLQTTIDNYIHVDVDERRAIAERLAKAVGELAK